jgi:hypothetical protein
LAKAWTNQAAAGVLGTLSFQSAAQAVKGQADKEKHHSAALHYGRLSAAGAI